jgi:hypothetical protein
MVSRRIFSTPGPALIGLTVDYRDSEKLFEAMQEGSIL